MSLFRKGDESDSGSDVENETRTKSGVTSKQDVSSNGPDVKADEQEDAGSDEEGGLFGNMMDLPDPNAGPSPEDEAETATISIRDLSVPKHLPSAFVLPKKLLSEMLYANTKTKAASASQTKDPALKGIPMKLSVVNLNYTDLSKGSRAKRARLEVEWSPDIGAMKNNVKGAGNKKALKSGSSTPASRPDTPDLRLSEGLNKLSLSSSTAPGAPAPSVAPSPTPPAKPTYKYSMEMTSTGCATLVEAENYISLVLLHELTTSTPHSLMLETKSAGLGIELPKPPKPPAPAVTKTEKPGEEKKEVPTAVDPKSEEAPATGTASQVDSKPLPSDPAKPIDEPKPEPLSPLEASVPLWLPEYPPINSKYLPLPYRDVWDELEKIRMNWEDMANRQVWRKLDGLINPSGKKDLAEEPVPLEENGKAAEPAAGSQAKPRGKKERANGQARSMEPDQRILDSWQVRANSQAYKKMMEQRETLPIASFRDEIVNTLKDNQVLVLSGETGCGKSTQLPSFILEDHLSQGLPCKIYVTEPRRISAISLAERVSRELGDKGVDAGGAGDDGGLVGYSIRLESKIGRNTRLAFVTNGIALRMLEAGASGSEGRGSTFDEVTHIIVDEVHERSIDSDFLLIVLKSLMEQRPDLKIVLMSATLESEKISEYFGGCPVLKVPGRTFPVKVGYLEDAVEFAGWAITDKSPYALKGRQNRNQLEWAEEPALDDDDEGETPVQADPKQLSSALYSQDTVKTVNLLDPKQIPYELVIRLLEELCLEQKSPYSQAILIFLPGLNEIRKLHDLLQDHKSFGMPQDFRVYPLHSSISTENQGAVFEIPPEGVRKIVLSTNIAETGVTIPDITCVIDSGKHREMRYDEKRAISRLTETYIARSNASQRRGRAGRVQEGLAFHLFTKARHDTQMAGHPLPEILRLSLQDLALRIKILKVKIGNTIAEGLSRALDPPLLVNITRAVNSLIEVGALTSTEQITPMGLLLSRLPVDVHLGKFLLFAALFRCLDPALTIAATLNSKSPFITPFGQESEADSIRSSFKTGNSDFLTIVNVFSIWRRMASTNPNQARTFCRRNFLSYQTLQQIEELRQQLYSYLIDSQFVPSTKADKDEISRARYHKGFRTMFVDIPVAYNENAEDEKLVAATLAAGLYPKILTTNNDTGGLKTLTGGQAISIHPSSVNFRMKMSEFEANHIVYFTIMQSKKLYAWETGPVEDMALFLLCGEHLEIKTWSGAAIIDRKIRFNVSGDLLLHLKRLREEFAQALSLRMSGKQFNEDQAKWFELGLKCLMTPPTPKEETIQRIGVQIK